MTSTTWSKVRAVLGRRYPDSWLWGAFLLPLALLYLFIGLGGYSGALPAALVLFSAAVGMFKCRAWGWLCAAIVLGITGLLMAVSPKGNHIQAAFTLCYAYAYWKGYRSFARVSRPQDATPD